MPRQLRILLLLCHLVAWEVVAAQPLNGSVGAAMRGRKGSAIVIDVASGRILASYDLRRAGRRRVRPGSTIKPFVLATLVDSGSLDRRPTVKCVRKLSVLGRKLDCGHPPGGAPLGPAEALAYSCNTYFTQMGSRLTAAQLQRELLRWGLASQTGLATDEVAGEILTAANAEELKLQSVGEEDIRITPLGLLSGFRRLAREQLQDGASAKTYAVVYAGLSAATEYGMARLAQPTNVEYKGKSLRVSGKTGTSRAEEGPWTHAWFAGFAPSERPEIAIVVFLEEGSGPTDAAPIARTIFQSWASTSHQ